MQWRVAKLLIGGCILALVSHAQYQAEVHLAGQTGDLKLVAVYRDGRPLAP